MILLLLSCSDKTSSSDTDLGYVLVDSGNAPQDSSPPLDTSEDSTIPVELYPKDTTLRVGAHVRLRAVAYPTDEPVMELTTNWSTTSTDIISIDGNTIHALQTGVADITAETDLGVHSLQINIIDETEITVHVYDIETQSPISGMTVTKNNSLVGHTDNSGTINVSSEDIDSISIYQQGYIPISVLSIPSTDIFLPAIPISESSMPINEYNGLVNFSELDAPDFNEVSIALTIPEHKNILSITLADIFNTTRTVSIFGTEASIPSSVSLGDYDSSFSVFSHLNTPSLSSFAINTPIASLTEAANGTDPFDLILPLIPDMVHDFDYSSPKPQHSLFPISAPQITNIPESFSESSMLIFHGVQNEEDSFKTCGLSIAESLNPTVYTSSAQNCNGSERFAACLFDSSESTHRSSVTQSTHSQFPSFMDSPKLQSFDPATKETTFGFSDLAQISQVWIQASDGSQRILYLPTHLQDIVLPTPPFPMGYGNTNWYIQQLHLTHGTYAQLLSHPGFSFESTIKAADSSSLIRFQLVQ